MSAFSRRDAVTTYRSPDVFAAFTLRSGNGFPIAITDRSATYAHMQSLSFLGA